MWYESRRKFNVKLFPAMVDSSHAKQVKGDDPDKKGYPGPPGWGFGVGLTIPHSKKRICTKV
jgi:hypothetical protein